ncbi:MAG: hypothetical protein CME81_02050 [Halomonas sp.]|nr:hypothetical protein [Halomonas sp.]
MFDTVAGIAEVGNRDFFAHDAETGRINVNVKPEHVQRAVQFVARDERQHNFSLSSLRRVVVGQFIPTRATEWMKCMWDLSPLTGYLLVWFFDLDDSELSANVWSLPPGINRAWAQG